MASASQVSAPARSSAVRSVRVNRRSRRLAARAGAFSARSARAIANSAAIRLGASRQRPLAEEPRRPCIAPARGQRSESADGLAAIRPQIRRALIISCRVHEIAQGEARVASAHTRAICVGIDGQRFFAGAKSVLCLTDLDENPRKSDPRLGVARRQNRRLVQDACGVFQTSLLLQAFGDEPVGQRVFQTTAHGGDGQIDGVAAIAPRKSGLDLG